MTDVFERLAPYIQDFIYQSEWTHLRANQVAACETVFETDDNLLLSSGTASGKTEAAFLPALTELYENPSKSVGILYISPLKALINDQFKRLEQLLEAGNIPVTKWHGDASAAKKNALVKKPAGVLQITPESLESMLVGKRGACLRLFSDLRFVIIDEVHYFMRSVRGTQVLCLLERLQQLTGNIPRRIGLSATLGDLHTAKQWLNTGTGRDCTAPVTDEGKRAIRLHVHRFVQQMDTEDSAASANREHYEYLFRMTLDKKTIVFANSREEIELVMANLREIARQHKSPDVYRVHHGNISAIYREQAEDEMKAEDEKIVTGATVTLELGIDIGSLDQVVQIGAPLSVSSFAQRLGRCGRRGQVPQLLFTFIDEVQPTAADFLGPINWSFLRTVAIIELYTKQKWIEPLYPPQYPYTLLYHQTMSHLKGSGELSPAKLAQDILSLEPFRKISKEEYKTLLSHWVVTEHLQKTELGGLIIGRNGEKVVNDFHFYTVFTVPEYYIVKAENSAVGTVDKIYPVGTRFALAGMTWETIDVNAQSKVLFVKQVPGISLVDWDVDFDSEIHTVVVQKIREILAGSQTYAYLCESSRDRLEEIRFIAKNSGILDHTVTQLTNKKFAIFPWVGTRQLATLHYLLLSKRIKSKLQYAGSVYLEVYYDGTLESLEQLLREIAGPQTSLSGLRLPEKIQITNKYSEFIPPQYLQKQFIEDFLDLEGLQNALKPGG